MAVNVTNATEEKRRSETTPADGTDADTSELSVTVHLRSSPSTPVARRQQSVVDRLDELVAAERVSEPAVERWGARVPVSTAEESAVGLYDDLSAAAEDAGARLDPFFERREVANGLLSAGPPTEEVIVFPAVSLTVRRGGDLVGLYPCWQDGTHHSVEDALDALAAGDSATNL